MQQLQPGNHVWVKDIQQKGTVVSTTGTPRSYTVETSRGSLQRNRFHLSQTTVAPATPSEISDLSLQNTTPAADPARSPDTSVTPESCDLRHKHTPAIKRHYPVRVRTAPFGLNYEKMWTPTLSECWVTIIPSLSGRAWALDTKMHKMCVLKKTKTNNKKLFIIWCLQQNQDLQESKRFSYESIYLYTIGLLLQVEKLCLLDSYRISSQTFFK